MLFHVIYLEITTKQVIKTTAHGISTQSEMCYCEGGDRTRGLEPVRNYFRMGSTVNPVLEDALLPPATKLGQGYVFTRVCDSVHGGGGSASVHAGIPPPRSRPPPEQTPPLEQTAPVSSACWEIWATSGRYASYWNAFLCY